MPWPQILTLFLVPLFGAYDSDPDLHVTRGSRELWPSVLEEFRRKHEQLSRGAEWAEPATTRWRNKVLEFLRQMDCSLPYRHESVSENSRRLRKVVDRVNRADKSNKSDGQGQEGSSRSAGQTQTGAV